MKQTIFFCLTCLVFSCAKEKVIELPEIQKAAITKIHDVSAAYLFYDETAPDSVELNRRNLISSTNWLINVDKRLTLKQVVPHIKFLQGKKNNSSHKNEKAKNYFTCHDLSNNNLGFIDFTNTEYKQETENPELIHITESEDSVYTKFVNFNTNGSIFILNPRAQPFVKKTDKVSLISDLKILDSTHIKIALRFDEKLTFQEYISFKSLISNAELKHATFASEEYLDN